MSGKRNKGDNKGDNRGRVVRRDGGLKPPEVLSMDDIWKGGEIAKGSEGVEVVKEVVETPAPVPVVEVETGGVKDLEAIKAGVPKELTKEEKKQRDEDYQEFKEDARKRADYLLEVVHPRMREMERDPEFVDRMTSDKPFREEYNGWKNTEEEILSRDEELRGLIAYKELLGKIIKTSDDVKVGRTGEEKKAKVRVKKLDMPELLNGICREAVEQGRLQKVSRETAKDQKYVVYNTRYGEEDEIYMPKPDSDMYPGIVTPATIGIVDALIYLKGLTHKYGPTMEELKQKRVKAMERTLKQRRQKMKDRCSDIPMSKLLGRDRVPDKSLLLGEYDSYIVQQGTKNEHEIRGATFCVRVTRGQIVPVEALGEKSDLFVEMIRERVNLPDWAIFNRKFVPKDRDEKTRKHKVVLIRMIEAVIYQYRLKHPLQKSKKVKTQKPEEKVVNTPEKTTEVVKEETPKVEPEVEVDLLGTGCLL